MAELCSDLGTFERLVKLLDLHDRICDTAVMTTNTTVERTHLVDEATGERWISHPGKASDPKVRAWVMRNKAAAKRHGRTLVVEKVKS